MILEIQVAAKIIRLATVFSAKIRSQDYIQRLTFLLIRLDTHLEST